jgi:hypothetical protein
MICYQPQFSQSGWRSIEGLAPGRDKVPSKGVVNLTGRKILDGATGGRRS